jgi:hypothetical protein
LPEVKSGSGEPNTNNQQKALHLCSLFRAVLRYPPCLAAAKHRRLPCTPQKILANLTLFFIGD